MKKSLFLMFFCLIVLFLSGCNQQDAVFDGGERYEWSGLTIYDTKTKSFIEESSHSTFRYLSGSYGNKSNYSMDNHNIYCNGKIIGPNYGIFRVLTGSDRFRTDEIAVYDENCNIISDDFSGFKIVSDSYIKDSRNVWYYTWSKNRVLTGADVVTFTGFFGDYVKDKNFVYFLGKKTEIDTDSFQEVGNEFMKDKYNLYTYYGGENIGKSKGFKLGGRFSHNYKNVFEKCDDSSSPTNIGKYYGKIYLFGERAIDDKYIYYCDNYDGEYRLSKKKYQFPHYVDLKTIEDLGWRFKKDKNNIYISWGFGCKFENNEYTDDCGFNFQILTGADPQYFRSIVSGFYDSPFWKDDKSLFYVGGSKELLNGPNVEFVTKYKELIGKDIEPRKNRHFYYFRDNKSIWYLQNDITDYYTKHETKHETKRGKLTGSDYNTFVATGNVDDGFHASDKSHKYKRAEIVE